MKKRVVNQFKKRLKTNVRMKKKNLQVKKKNLNRKNQPVKIRKEVRMIVNAS